MRLFPAQQMKNQLYPESGNLPPNNQIQDVEVVSFEPKFGHDQPCKLVLPQHLQAAAGPSSIPSPRGVDRSWAMRPLLLGIVAKTDRQQEDGSSSV